MQEIFEGLLGGTIVIGSLWLILHYRWKMTQKNAFSDADQEHFEALCSQANRLEERVKVLESILDYKVPDWRRYY